MDLKQVLGEKYEEFSALLGETKVIVDDGKMIPKTRFDEVNNQLKDLKKQIADINMSKLTDEERLKQSIEDTKIERSRYLKELARLKAEQVFVEGGLTQKDYKEFIEDIVTDSEESTVALAKKMVKVVQSKNQEIEAKVKADLLKQTPTPPANQTINQTATVTKEQFSKMDYTQRTALKQTNPELFKELSN